MPVVGSFRERQQRIWNAEDAILSEDLNDPVPTDALISKLLGPELDDYAIRAAIWALVERGKIELRPERGDVFIARAS
jgi:L-rhamnose isomerase